jgi:DNA topoisomerase VI subunit B
MNNTSIKYFAKGGEDCQASNSFADFSTVGQHQHSTSKISETFPDIKGVLLDTVRAIIRTGRKRRIARTLKANDCSVSAKSFKESHRTRKRRMVRSMAMTSLQAAAMPIDSESYATLLAKAMTISKDCAVEEDRTAADENDSIIGLPKCLSQQFVGTEPTTFSVVRRNMD